MQETQDSRGTDWKTASNVFSAWTQTAPDVLFPNPYLEQLADRVEVALEEADAIRAEMALELTDSKDKRAGVPQSKENNFLSADRTVTGADYLALIVRNAIGNVDSGHSQEIIEFAESEEINENEESYANLVVNGIPSSDLAAMRIHLMAFTALCDSFEEQRQTSLEERAFISHALAILLEIARMPVNGVDFTGHEGSWLLKKLAFLKKTHQVPFPAWSGPLGSA